MKKKLCLKYIVSRIKHLSVLPEKLDHRENKVVRSRWTTRIGDFVKPLKAHVEPTKKKNIGKT